MILARARLAVFSVSWRRARGIFRNEWREQRFRRTAMIVRRLAQSGGLCLPPSLVELRRTGSAPIRPTSCFGNLRLGAAGREPTNSDGSADVRLKHDGLKPDASCPLCAHEPPLPANGCTRAVFKH